MSADGSHLEFPIGKKDITFVEVYPMINRAMFAAIFNFQSAQKPQLL